MPRSVAGQVQRVDPGTVVATRTVEIDGEATYLGQSGGAIVGSAVGQSIGSGDGRILASAGGAVVGGIVGGMVEKELSKKRAQELTISLDDGNTVVVIQELEDVGFIEGDRVNVSQTRAGEALVAHAHYESDGLY
ncbi:glycine zipper domain-containing protein [Pelagicoccus sp. SDUM812003]|uniref:glycine zipper domain-containing protein n=1 Tax=Pelagicoccus sp. SDUM812003 TaxID=3041267 RepID=UPI00281007E4|nr:glycine zipper domain-containing protein [Pelagicoccus sp. SDUM812003]MDQ8203380.1 glycine zipper domain-containing protein [Pelagicoccus sp. SDUM812003]